MRIAFLTDIHIGATPAGWQQQTRWCEGIPHLLTALRQQLAQLRPDLLILGGDLVEDATPDAIEGAVAQLRDLPGPTLVCLGNHDLTEPASYPCWRRALWSWPTAALADRLLEFRDCDICALNNYWLIDGRPQLRWDRQMPVATLTPAQLQQFDGWLSRRTDRPAVLALHAPIEPLPPQLTGAAAPAEPPPPEYASALRALLDRHPRVRAVLAGHCHAACATPQRIDAAGSSPSASPRLHLTATSFSEVPYQFPLLEIAPGRLHVTTHRLQVPGQGPSFNPDRAWVVGRDSDREVSLP